MIGIKERLKRVEERMDQAARKSGRTLKDILLVAVTKGAQTDAVLEARDAGIGVFAENRVQEAASKIPQISAEWHMVGHLQSNKVKEALGLFGLIQSLDSISLAKKINQESALLGKEVPVLLEVNISGEAQRYGFKPEEIYTAIETMGQMTQLRVLGLMGIAPNTPDPPARADAFKKLKNIFSACKSIRREKLEMKYLSMGMSDDFEIAIEQGSNMIRLGRALFQ